MPRMDRAERIIISRLRARSQRRTHGLTRDRRRSQR